jgi:hypothetical protein
MRQRPVAYAAMVLALVAAALVGLASPASAATADRWGFAYVDDPTVPLWTNLDPTKQAGTWAPGLQAQGGKIAPGRFLVRFPSIGLGARGNVHVTPVNRTGHYCEILRWFGAGVDEIVDVQCHRPGGVPEDSRFTVLWTYSSGVLPPTDTGSYASVQYGTTSVVQFYNSTGNPVTVTPLGPPGQYLVRFALVGAKDEYAGNLQVTAVQPNAQPRRCKVAKWGPVGYDVLAYVFCYGANGLGVNSEFTASYHRERSVVGSFGPPKYIGYVWSAGAGQTNFNYPSGGFGFNSIGAIAPAGRYLVKYPNMALNEDHSQVTAYGNGNNYCHLTQPWQTFWPDIQVDVLCFDNFGNPMPHRFFNTFTNKD